MVRRRGRTIHQFLLLWFLIIFAPLSASALTVPPLTGRVVDNASILSPAAVQVLEKNLAAFEGKESTQIVILTINSLEGDSLEDFSLRVAEQWGIGQKGKDNGALLLISKNDRKIRIEVGYGLEGSLTDLTAGQIIRNIITPRFRNGDFDRGVIEGVSAMIAAVHGEFTGSPPPSGKQSETGDFGGIIIFLLFAFFNLGRMFQSHKWLAGGLGAVIAPLLGFTFFGVGGVMLLFLIPAGLLAGLLFSSLSFGSPSGGSSGGYSSGGFGGGGFGGGGFSGGGGGFGGGGSSGGW
jgi:uncharacterized protein